MMLRKILSGMTLLALLGVYTPVFAEENDEFNLIDILEIDPDINLCEEAIPLSGIATVEDGQQLIVKLDGQNFSIGFDGIFWTSEPVRLSQGNHKLIATIMAGSDVIASAEMSVDASSCGAQSSTEVVSDNSKTSNVGGDIQEPAPLMKKSKPKVVVAVRGGIVNKAVPSVVARIFTQLYGRSIKPAESTYWKNRARTDKRTETTLRGAMQFYKGKGLTKGK